MECLKAPLAIALCWSLVLPAPLRAAQQFVSSTDHPLTSVSHRQAYQSTQIQGDERILHALNRFTFGPKPGDVESVRTMGLDAWFEEQLHPASIDQKDLNAHLAKYPAMQWTPEDLLYRAPNPAIIRQALNGKGSIPENGTLHAVYENQMYRLQLKKEEQGKKADAAGAPQTPQNAAGTPPAMNAAISSTTAGSNPTVNAAAPKTMAMNQDAGMAASSEPSMAANRAASPGAMQGASQDSMSGAGSMDMSMAPAQAGAMNAPMNSSANVSTNAQGENPKKKKQLATETADGQPAFSPQDIAAILALQPEQRVMRLSNMQPEQFDSFMKSLKGPQRQLLVADLNPSLRECVEDLENPRQMVVNELFAQRLTRDIYSSAQLQEVMSDFWFNHFNVFVGKDEQEPYYLVSYERDVIRPRALGKFEDLLESVAHSPAMMLYLDNAQSVGPDSFFALRAKENDYRRPAAKRQAPQGLNENYARELMELHTLGVNGGYTQADVTQVARILTGWTIDRPQLGGGFMFNPMRHEPGAKVVMGQKFKENGEMEGRELLHFLATRPATAQFLSRKLAIRFVSDAPPQALVDRMAKAYLASDGDIATVLTTLFRSPEFWAQSDYRAKVKTPLEYVVSAARVSNANMENMQPLVAALRQMGMPLYGAVPPVGYKWDAADWVSTGALVDRMNFSLSLSANRLPGITVEWAPEVDINALMNDDSTKQVIPTPESEEARLEPLLIAGGVSDATRAAALKEFQQETAQNPATAMPAAQRRPNNRAPVADAYEREDQLLAGLLLGSPEFQRR